MNLKESAMRIRGTFILISSAIKLSYVAKPREEVEVTSSEIKKWGRPPLLGKNMDNHLQQLITAMQSWSQETPIGTTTINAIVLSCATPESWNFSLEFSQILQNKFFYHKNFHTYSNKT